VLRGTVGSGKIGKIGKIVQERSKTMPRGRTVTAQSKVQVVLEVLSGVKTSAEVCSQYQIHPNLFYKWCTTLLEGAPLIFNQEERRSAEQESIAELERMLGRLTMELEAAKKPPPCSD
jgi:transposase